MIADRLGQQCSAGGDGVHVQACLAAAHRDIVHPSAGRCAVGPLQQRPCPLLWQDALPRAHIPGEE